MSFIFGHNNLFYYTLDIVPTSMPAPQKNKLVSNSLQPKSSSNSGTTIVYNRYKMKVDSVAYGIARIFVKGI